MSLSDDIGSAVDTFAAASTPDTPASTPAAPVSTTSTVTTPSPVTPAPRAGSDARSPKDAKLVGSTTQSAPAGAASTEPQPTVTPGEPPKEKWDSILSNARRDTETAVIGRYGGMTPEAYTEQWKPHVDAIQQNPVAYYQWLGAQLSSRGMLPPSGNGTPQQPQEPERMPEPSLVAVGQDGRQYGAYSADDVQKAIAFSQSQLLAKLEPRLQPIDEIVHQQKVTQVLTKSEKDTQALIAEAETWDAFDELKEKIGELILKDGRRTLHSAYQQAYREHYLPQSKAKIRQAVLDELKTAPASQTISPTLPPRGNGHARGNTLDDRLEAALRPHFSH